VSGESVEGGPEDASPPITVPRTDKYWDEGKDEESSVEVGQKEGFCVGLVSKDGLRQC
jgi:hypothetical protein